MQDFRRLEFNYFLEPVVPVYDAHIEFVYVRACDRSVFEEEDRAEIRRHDRQHLYYHVDRLCAGLLEPIRNLESLICPFGRILFSEIPDQLINIEIIQKGFNERTSCFCLYLSFPYLIRVFKVPVLPVRNDVTFFCNPIK